MALHVTVYTDSTTLKSANITYLLDNLTSNGYDRQYPVILFLAKR